MNADHNDSVGLLPLGMHRSGTSLLTRILALAGVWLGEHDDVWATGEDNPTGFWEHRVVREVNLQLMRAQGNDWHLPLGLSLAQVEPELDAKLKQQADAVLTDLKARGLWAIKDPRMCLTLPWWQPMLGEVVFILINRSPVDIARSLQVRDGFSLEFGFALWEHYTVAAATHAASAPHAILSYDELIDRPLEVLDRLTAELSAFGVELQPIVEAELDQFIRTDLRHSMSGPELTRRLLSPSQWEIYNAFKRGDLKAIAAKGLSAMARKAIEAEQKIRDAGLSELARRIELIGAEMTSQIEAKASAIASTEPAQPRADAESQPSRTALENEVIKNLHGLGAIIKAVDHRLTEVTDHTDREVAQMADQVQRLASQAVTLEQVEALLDRRRELDARQIQDERRLAADELAHLHRKLRQLGQQAELSRQLQQELDQSAASASLMKSELAQARVENLTLRKWLSDVLHWSDLTRDSARWKVGSALIRACELALFRRKPQLAIDAIAQVRGQFHSLAEPAGIARPDSVGERPNEPDFGLDVDPRLDKEAHDFLVFPIIDWDFRIQRPQHLAKELARAGHRVFYLTLQPRLGAPAPGYRIIKKPSQGVHLLRLEIPSQKFPNVYEQRMDGSVVRELAAALALVIDRVRLRRIVSIVDLHFWRPLAMALPGTPVVYDCMDYHGGFSTATEDSDREENKLIRDCDLLIVTSRWLWNRFARVEPKALVPNAGEVEFFARRPDSPADLGNKPVAGYIGAIADWFDVQLVVKAARARPDINFVLVGSTAFCDTRPMENLANIRLVGEIPYFDVPRYLHAFDCCIIPFQLTPLIQATNPVKIYEYLAAGKPIVSTNLPELHTISGLVHLATDDDEFLNLIDVALAEAGDRKLAESRSLWARDNDWSHRREELLVALDVLYPMVSIVVLCYNNLDFTRACLESLIEFSDYPNTEIIAVDNGSSDETPAYLTAFGADHPNVKVILNETNLGFAAGNNVGLAAASGDYLVILNNDTFVTRGWLFGLLRHFHRDPKLGLVGPVTNNIGNEARIEVNYANMQEMAHQAFHYSSVNAGKLIQVETVAFFCVAMPRKVYAEVGAIDEQFGQGFFEDDDYCRRVTEAGYQIAIAEDVFIHHHLSATFAKEDQQRRDRLFQANKKKYEAKWGAWQPHRYRREKAS